MWFPAWCRILTAVYKIEGEKHLCTTASLSWTFCTERETTWHQQIYFSGWPHFVHTCLGLICLIWRYFYLKFSSYSRYWRVHTVVPDSKCFRCMYKILYPTVKCFRCIYKNLYNVPHNISRCCVQSHYWRDSHPDRVCTKRGQPGKSNYASHNQYLKGLFMCASKIFFSTWPGTISCGVSQNFF